jgi:hypothetical protein
MRSQRWSRRYVEADFKVRLYGCSRHENVQQTQHDDVANCDVGGKQQGSIVSRPRAPRRERVDAEGCRASDEDLDTVAGTFVRWGHAACARKNGTIKNGPSSGNRWGAARCESGPKKTLFWASPVIAVPGAARVPGRRR